VSSVFDFDSPFGAARTVNILTGWTFVVIAVKVVLHRVDVKNL